MSLEEYRRHLHELAMREGLACSEKLHRYGHTEENIFAILESGAERAGISMWQVILTWMDRAMSLRKDTPEEEKRILLKDLYGYCCLALAWEKRAL